MGLSGELRPASRENLRLKEMSALGFQKLVVSSGSAVEEIQQSHPSISWQRLKSVSEIPGALFAEGGKARETDGQAKALL